MKFTKFDWDQSKRYSNIEKHGIDFAAVPPIFDGHCLIREDHRQDYREIKMCVPEQLNGVICYVVYTMFENLRNITFIPLHPRYF